MCDLSLLNTEYNNVPTDVLQHEHQHKSGLSKKAYKTPLTAVLNHGVENGIDASSHESVCDKYTQVLKHCKWVVETPEMNYLHTIWTILIILYVSDNTKRSVSEHTNPQIAISFFDSFNKRFERHLCGQLRHLKEGKQSILAIQAKTPFEIALMELLEIKKLYMKYPS